MTDRLIAIRIAGLLASPSLAPTKLDELKVKANILSSFALNKAEDAYDAAADAIVDAKDKTAEGVESVKKMVGDKVEQIREEL